MPKPVNIFMIAMASIGLTACNDDRPVTNPDYDARVAKVLENEEFAEVIATADFDDPASAVCYDDPANRTFVATARGIEGFAVSESGFEQILQRDYASGEFRPQVRFAADCSSYLVYGAPVKWYETQSGSELGEVAISGWPEFAESGQALLYRDGASVMRLARGGSRPSEIASLEALEEGLVTERAGSPFQISDSGNIIVFNSKAGFRIADGSGNTLFERGPDQQRASLSSSTQGTTSERVADAYLRDKELDAERIGSFTLDPGGNFVLISMRGGDAPPMLARIEGGNVEVAPVSVEQAEAGLRPPLAFPVGGGERIFSQRRACVGVIDRATLQSRGCLAGGFPAASFLSRPSHTGRFITAGMNDSDGATILMIYDVDADRMAGYIRQEVNDAVVDEDNGWILAWNRGYDLTLIAKPQTD